MSAVTIPVMAKARIGHFAEAQILEAIGVDMIDESEGKDCVIKEEISLHSGWKCAYLMDICAQTLSLPRSKQF